MLNPSEIELQRQKLKAERKAERERRKRIIAINGFCAKPGRSETIYYNRKLRRESFGFK